MVLGLVVEMDVRRTHEGLAEMSSVAAGSHPSTPLALVTALFALHGLHLVPRSALVIHLGPLVLHEVLAPFCCRNPLLRRVQSTNQARE